MLPQFVTVGISLTAGISFRSVCTISQVLSTPQNLHTPLLWQASLLASPASSQNTVSQWVPNTTQIGAIFSKVPRRQSMARVQARILQMP